MNENVLLMSDEELNSYEDSSKSLNDIHVNHRAERDVWKMLLMPIVENLLKDKLYGALEKNKDNEYLL